MMPPRRVAVAGVAAVLGFGVMWASASALRDAGRVRNMAWHRFVAGPLHTSTEVSETFFMRDDGLSAVTVWPRAGPGSTGRLNGEVYELVADGQRLRMPLQRQRLVGGVEVPLSSLTRDAPVTVTFTPQRSLQRWFEIRLRVFADEEIQDFGYVATGGDSYPIGLFFVGGERRWGDLMFDTTLEPRKVVETFVARLASAGVPHPRLAWTLLLALPAALFAAVAFGLITILGSRGA